VGQYEPLLSFWGKAQAAKRFPGYYRGLRERWMRESRCLYFSVIRPKSGGTVPPALKVGVHVGLPPINYAYGDETQKECASLLYHLYVMKNNEHDYISMTLTQHNHRIIT